MLRPLLLELVLFALPFLVYAIRGLLRGRPVFTAPGWANAPLLPLLAVAVVCVGLGLALFAHFGGIPAGSAYVPAHMENGKLIQPETR